MTNSPAIIPSPVVHWRNIWIFISKPAELLWLAGWLAAGWRYCCRSEVWRNFYQMFWAASEEQRGATVGDNEGELSDKYQGGNTGPELTVFCLCWSPVRVRRWDGEMRGCWCLVCSFVVHPAQPGQPGQQSFRLGHRSVLLLSGEAAGSGSLSL